MTKKMKPVPASPVTPPDRLETLVNALVANYDDFIECVRRDETTVNEAARKFRHLKIVIGLVGNELRNIRERN